MALHGGGDHSSISQISINNRILSAGEDLRQLLSKGVPCPSMVDPRMGHSQGSKGILCPSMVDPWMGHSNLVIRGYSVRGARGYRVHPWLIHGWDIVT